MGAAGWVLGISIFLGLVALGWQLGTAAIRFKELERTVTVKGLSEREVEADIAIWPIRFSAASNDLESLYATIESHTARIREFLEGHGIPAEAISTSPPNLTDKSAQQWGGSPPAELRYSAVQTVTVYSTDVPTVRAAMSHLADLGSQGIVFTGNAGHQTEYIFSKLNEIKPAMIEEATRNAREVATKFADDSQSSLGKIRRARQGQFSITNRDSSNAHIKKVRVVSTVEYLLSD
jgi:hypothetical protein